jgi:phage tail-like protein
MAGHLSESQWGTPSFHFNVIIDGVQLSFQEVSGLTSTTEVIEYRHGDSVVFSPQKQLAQTKFDNLVLKKGVFAMDSHIIDLFNQVFDKNYMSHEDGRMDIVVNLLDELGAEVMTWNFTNCIPTKMSLGGMKSDSNEMAIEEIEFAVEGAHLLM